jgi:hypothetical protein
VVVLVVGKRVTLRGFSVGRIGRPWSFVVVDHEGLGDHDFRNVEMRLVSFLELGRRRMGSSCLLKLVKLGFELVRKMRTFVECCG